MLTMTMFLPRLYMVHLLFMPTMAMLRLLHMLIMPAMARLSMVMPRLPMDMVPLLSKEMLICTAMEPMAPMDMAATTGSVDSTAPSQLDTTLDSETNTGSGR